MTVRVAHTDETDLSGLIVELTVTTGRKNPYHIDFPKTDASGLAILTRADFIGQFTDHWESGLMDHSGTPESADSTVRVALYDPSWSLANRDAALAWPLLTHERTKWSSRDEQYRYRTSSRNLEFLASPITVDLARTNDVVLPVERKGTRPGA
ncbi:MAG TPA: hypothetical protein VF381_00985 [Thermoanaerobaculia bacterium]